MTKNDKNIIIRSTKSSIKFSNKNKLNSINLFVDEYKRITQKFVDILWENKDKKISSLLDKSITNQINDSWLSQRAIQSAGKQASGIVRGTVQKHKQRLYKLKELMKLKTNTKKLQRKIDRTILTKPNLKSVSPELDSRFIEIINSDNSFDLWVKLSSIGNKQVFYIPIKKTEHFNKLINENYNLKKGIRISKTSITFMFEKEQIFREKGETLGIDIGIKNTISASNNFYSTPCKHNHTLESIQKTLSNKKKGSKNFKQTQEHRKNYINWTINQLNLDNFKTVKLEKIKNMRYKSRSSRFMSHWTYTDIFDKLCLKCEELGVQVLHISPTYTSQRCSACGWTRKRNRKGKVFKCEKCNFTSDSDLNGSFNISLDLPEILWEKRHAHDNKKGFYWHVRGEEPIVPLVNKE
ncbi:MAG: transposase [Clostridia bacterium]|jgi:IS605 OrfB family transposase